MCVRVSGSVVSPYTHHWLFSGDSYLRGKWGMFLSFKGINHNKTSPTHVSYFSVSRCARSNAETGRKRLDIIVSRKTSLLG
jgi:hypothetical protein